MSNVIAGVIRDQYHHLSDHIAQKKAVYERYKEGLKDLPVQMNPFDETKAEPNYWLSSMIIDEEAMCKQVRSDTEALYVAEAGKSCPTEILEAISSINAEGRPIWKPMHMQPMYRMNEFVTVSGSGRAKTKRIRFILWRELMIRRYFMRWPVGWKGSGRWETLF